MLRTAGEMPVRRYLPRQISPAEARVTAPVVQRRSGSPRADVQRAFGLGSGDPAAELAEVVEPGAAGPGASGRTPCVVSETVVLGAGGSGVVPGPVVVAGSVGSGTEGSDGTVGSDGSDGTGRVVLPIPGPIGVVMPAPCAAAG